MDHILDHKEHLMNIENKVRQLEEVNQENNKHTRALLRNYLFIYFVMKHNYVIQYLWTLVEFLQTCTLLLSDRSVVPVVR